MVLGIMKKIICGGFYLDEGSMEQVKSNGKTIVKAKPVSVAVVNEAVEAYLSEHPVEAGLQPYELSYDGVSLYHDGAEVGFEDIYEYCTNSNYVTYVVHNNRQYALVYVDNTHITFAQLVALNVSSESGGTPKMYYFDITSSDAVSYSDYTLVKKSEYNTLSWSVTSLQNTVADLTTRVERLES